MVKGVQNRDAYIAAAFFLEIFLIGCSLSPQFDLAESANFEFQKRLRLKQYDEMYKASAPAFRKTTTPSQLAASMDAVNDKLSGCYAGTPGIKIGEWGSGGSVVTVNYMLHCVNGELYEALSWEVVDGKLLLTNFAISSAPFRIK